MSVYAPRSAVFLLLLIVVWGCTGEFCSAATRQMFSEEPQQSTSRTSNKETNTKMDALFERALVSYGPDYLSAEKSLRLGGDAAAASLRTNLTHPDPVARTMAKCLLDWIEGRSTDYPLALGYLDSLPERIKRTPITTPSPTGVAAYLRMHFGPRVADLLAVHLVKRTDWPHWRVMGVIFYLQELHLSSTTAALIRFAAETRNEEWRHAAIEAIKAAHDPGLAEKIEYESRRLLSLERNFPEALTELAVTN